jgi:peptidyl-prolyl cis-trans isomerase D
MFKTAKKYSFDVVWVETKDVNVTDSEIEAHFKENSFKYTDTKGKLLSLDEAKPLVIKEIKLKKSKKDANRKYISYKKGQIEKSETITYDINDFRLSKEVWDEVTSKQSGDLLKPKVVGSRYAILKIVDIKEPTIKSFEEAKDELTPLYKSEESKEMLAKLSEENLRNIDKIEGKVLDFITFRNIEKQKLGLNQQELAELASKLFTSDQEKGIISIGDKIVVYKVMEQKLISLDKNETVGLEADVNQLKQQSFQSNLMKQLDKKYPTKFYK